MSKQAQEQRRQISSRQQIIDQIRDVYEKQPGPNLTQIADELKQEVFPPRPKVTVMLIGNHSSGKSSFVNYYIGADVQREGAAMETTGFTWIVSGKKRDTHKGSATLYSLGYLKDITKFDNVMDNLITEVVPSKERAFPLCDLVDTPGLTDGGLVYPYAINDILAWIADKVDLIFCFFDPHGQALCERTRQVVQSIESNPTNRNKLTFVLTKIDTFKNEQEKGKVMVQLSQSLTQAHFYSETAQKKGFGNHALNVLGIFLPHKCREDLPEQHRCWNELDELCSRIDAKIKETVQNHCELLQTHGNQLLKLVDSETALEQQKVERNKRIHSLRNFSLFVVWTLPLLLLFYLLHAFEAMFPGRWKDGGVLGSLVIGVRALASVVGLIDSETNAAQMLVGSVVAFFILLGVSRFIDQCKRAERKPEQVAQLKEWRSYLAALTAPKTGTVHRLWHSFLNESREDDVPEHS